MKKKTRSINPTCTAVAPPSISTLKFEFDNLGWLTWTRILIIMWVEFLQVPGATGNFVFIKDAIYKKPDVSLLPFPTYFAPEDEDLENFEALVADIGDTDPFLAAD